MEKVIIFDCVDDDYRVTLFNDASVEITHIDGFIDVFVFFDEFYMAYGLAGSTAVLMMIDHFNNTLHVLKNYEITDKQQKSVNKELFIKKIKSEALDAYYNRDNEKSSDDININIYHCIPEGMAHSEAVRIVNLPRMRKLVPCFINNELLVNITAASKK